MANPNLEIFKTMKDDINRQRISIWLTIFIKSISLLGSLVFFIIFVMAVWHGGVILVGESPKDCFIFGKIHGLKTLF